MSQVVAEVENEQEKKAPPEGVDAECAALNEGYNKLIRLIPWESLKGFPEKLKGVGKLLGFNPNDVDIVTPLRSIVKYVGVVVKDINLQRRRNNALATEVATLRLQVEVLTPATKKAKS